MRRRSGIARPRSGSGNGTGRVTRDAKSFWPKNQDTRAACAALKESLSRAEGIATALTARTRVCKGPASNLAASRPAAYDPAQTER
jgi:hypothetical protein